MNPDLDPTLQRVIRARGRPLARVDRPGPAGAVVGTEQLAAVVEEVADDGALTVR